MAKIQVADLKMFDQPTNVHFEEVVGQSLGPFVVHPSFGVWTGWTVTHRKTGFAVAQGLASRERARNLARRLRDDFPKGTWAFDDPKATKQWPEKQKAKARRLLEASL